MIAGDLTVGVEEEFYLVDDAGLLVHRAPEALREIDHDGIDVKPELLRCQAEAGLRRNRRQSRGRLLLRFRSRVNRPAWLQRT